MDKKIEAQRRADEAAAKLLDPNATPITSGTNIRADLAPASQDDAKDAAELSLKTQEEGEAQERSAVASANYNAAQQAADDGDDAPKTRKKKDRMIEVLTLKKYTPHNVDDGFGNQIPNTGVMQTVPVGTTLQLPEAEAQRALQLGIAQVTDNTFKR
jgi:hypothetical protein